jgi:hypothetical protein
VFCVDAPYSSAEGVLNTWLMAMSSYWIRPRRTSSIGITVAFFDVRFPTQVQIGLALLGLSL